MARLMFDGRITDIYEGEKSSNVSVTFADMETGGVQKVSFPKAKNFGVEMGDKVKVDLEVIGQFGKNFSFFMSICLARSSKWDNRRCCRCQYSVPKI